MRFDTAGAIGIAAFALSLAASGAAAHPGGQGGMQGARIGYAQTAHQAHGPAAGSGCEAMGPGAAAAGSPSQAGHAHHAQGMTQQGHVHGAGHAQQGGHGMGPMHAGPGAGTPAR